MTSSHLLTSLRLITTALCFSLFSNGAHAYVEINGFYYSDALTTATSRTSSRMIFEGSVGFPIDRAKRFMVGWNYSMHSANDTTTTESTYSSTQMGPRLLIALDRKNAWSLGLGWNLVSKASNKDGASASAEWKGSAYKFDVGYNFPVGEELYLGLRLNYSMANYSEQLVGSTYTDVSYSKTALYPSVYCVYIF